jgi:predicted CxxxxCH...CXXCH cytochrome family protein
MARKDLTICRDCHGTPTANNPRFNVVYGSLPLGCESSGCHLIQTAHPKPWNSHATAGNQANACALCHGTTYGGGTGPACSSCHTLLVAGTIPSAGRCDSCHGNSPTGGNSGMFSGSHAVHLALPELKSNCAACHSGGGSNSAVHLVHNNARPAVIGVSVAFTTKSGGAPTFNAAAETCSSVSCHGGLTTPVWGTRISLDCAACHASGTTQYNSYHSGRHDSHISQGVACTDCHDTSKLASGHFSNLSSATLNQAASGTLRSYLTYNPVVGPPTCSPAARPADTQFSAPSCHGTLGGNQQKWQ